MTVCGKAMLCIFIVVEDIGMKSQKHLQYYRTNFAWWNIKALTIVLSFLGEMISPQYLNVSMRNYL